MTQSIPPLQPSRRGQRRLLLALCIIAIAAGLLVARPWQGRQVDCSLTVRPGESIQAAIAAAEAGDVICLARGTWIENIVIDKPLTLVGRGVGRTAIKALGLSFPIIAVSGGGSEPISVTLEGLSLSGDGGVSGVAIDGLAEVEIRNCAISGRWYGIEATDSARLTLSHSTVSENTQRGVVLSGSVQAIISHSSISANTGVGLWLSGTAEAVFDDCKITDNLRHGLWLREEARAMLSDCSVSRNRGHGLWLTGRSVAQLLRSDISGNWDQGIVVEDSAGAELTESEVLSNWHGVEFRDTARGTIAGTTVSRNRWDGIGIKGSAMATIAGSTVSNNMRGIWAGNQASAEIRDCLIDGNSGYGVFAWYGSEVAGEGNRFSANGIDLGGNLSGTLRLPLREPSETVIIWPDDRYASLQEAIDALLPGGTLRLEPGIYMAGLTIGTRVSIAAGDADVVMRAKSSAVPVLSLVDGAELHLEGATISGGSEGLLVSAGATVSLVACTISSNLQGINLSYSSSADVRNCNVVGSERSGVFVGGSAQAVVTGCSISSNSGTGIAVADSARVTVTDSLVTGSRGDGGIVIWASAQAVLQGNEIIDNIGFGVAIFERPCFRESPWPFQGRISGSSNIFGANLRGDVCPPELAFLATAEGGELDLRL